MAMFSDAELIQWRGDAELPADGNWILHRASFGRHRFHRQPDGAFVARDITVRSSTRGEPR
jgi:hypothetical protein